MVVRADASQAASEGQAFENSLTGIAQAEREAATAATTMGGATDAAGAKVRKTAGSVAEQRAQLKLNAAAINEVVRATNPAISSQAQLDAALARVLGQYIRGKVGAETYAQAQRIAARATAENVQWQQRLAGSVGQTRVGTMMLGQQIQDIGMQLALGTDFLRVMAMQAGQTALAIQQMGGRASGFATFIGGPWGSLILAGVSILALFASQSREAETTQLNLADAADTLGRAQSLLGNFIDLTTGKQSAQNEVMREAIRLTAILAQLEAQRAGREAGARLAALRPVNYLGPNGMPIDNTFYSGEVGGLGTRPGEPRVNPGVAAFEQLVQNYRRNGNASIAEFRRSVEGMAARGELQGLDVNAAVREALTVAINRQEIATMRDVQRVAEGGELPSYLRRPGANRRTRRGRDGSAARNALEEFGEDARNRIAGIAGRFEDQPRLLEQVRVALGQIDDLVDDIERRRPPNWQALVQQAEAARAVIRDAVDRPYRQYLEQSEQQLAIQRLITQGRHAEAEALQIVNRLEAAMGPLSQERKDAILETVEALRAEERQLEINRQKQEKYLSALGDVRSTIVDTIESGFRNIADIPRRLQATFNRLSAEYIFESLFGDTFRQLERQIRGENTAEAAAERFSTAVDGAERSTRGASDALERLATSADRAGQSIGSQSATPDLDNWNAAGAGFVGGQSGDPMAAIRNLFGIPEDIDWRNAIGGGDGQEITVTGQRPFRLGGGGIPTDPRGFMGHILGQLAEGLLGRDASKVIGGVVSRGLEGAMIGQAVGGVVGMAGKALGFKTSQTGAQIGGMVGNFIPGLPPGVGSAIGSALGSIVGGLFKSTKKSSVTLTNAYDDFSATGSQSLRGAATGAGAGVQAGLQNIADQLGATLGGFNVSIGLRDGKYRVDPTGRGNTKTKKGAKDFGEDEQAAIMFAIMDAIRDGAVQGLSAAVTRALQSSTDVDRALREALRVQELEDLIGGLGGKLQREFKNFDKLAAERVRLATKYGLDLLAVEKINAEERAALIETVTQDRIGSALQFLKDMKFGDLFEGDAATRRNLILDEIAATRVEAEAGIDGAADRLVDLYRRLIETSEEAFGTAGPELTGDRAAATTGIERVIELENARIAAAQGLQQATTDAINQGNALTNETNGLLAITNGRLSELIGLVGLGGSLGTATGGSGGLGAVARHTNLQLV